MPIFEYHCLDCHLHFERLRPADQRDTPSPCPNCDSPRVKRALSLVAPVRMAAGAQDSRAPIQAGGGCGCGGSCSCH
ncbi:MAG TPA: zinc ribbon domain-containing protein [Chloroflexia bacterium]|nr:zinc ribbon domain-containing protein [Chloroflexia bacterium]